MAPIFADTFDDYNASFERWSQVVIDTRSGSERPLIGVDAVDYQPQSHEVVVQRTPNGDVELGRGSAAGR